MAWCGVACHRLPVAWCGKVWCGVLLLAVGAGCGFSGYGLKGLGCRDAAITTDRFYNNLPVPVYTKNDSVIKIGAQRVTSTVPGTW